MSKPKFSPDMSLEEDIAAFHQYVDRSKAEGRMMTIDPSDPKWEETLDQKIRQATSDEV